MQCKRGLTRALGLPLGCAALLLAGCASLNVAPFRDFQSAIQGEKTAMNGALDAGTAWVRSGEALSFDGQFSQLVIQPGLGYDWSLAPMPLYLKIRQARQAFWELNQAMQEYAALLLRLADNQVNDPAQFESLAKQLNQNTAAAAQALQWQTSAEAIPIFSAAAITAGRAYIMGKKYAAMEKTIKENQALVEKYVAHCRSLAQLLRESIKAFYGEHYQTIYREWKQTPAGPRADLVERMYALNERFTDMIKTLEQIDRTFDALPAAHVELAQAVAATAVTFDRPGLQRLVEEGQRLQRLYEEMKRKP